MSLRLTQISRMLSVCWHERSSVFSIFDNLKAKMSIPFGVIFITSLANGNAKIWRFRTVSTVSRKKVFIHVIGHITVVWRRNSPWVQILKQEHYERTCKCTLVYIVFLRVHEQFCRFDKADTTADIRRLSNHRPQLWCHFSISGYSRCGFPANILINLSALFPRKYI